jgi:hypothetical protein
MSSLFPSIPIPPPPSNMFSISSDEDISTESLPENIEVRNLIINQKDKENVDYLCPICKEFMIPDECIELHCGHLFCKKCIYSVNTSLSLTAKCPLCNKSSSTFKYIKTNNKFAYKILCSVKIHCPNEGCDHELFAGDLKYHVKKCDYVLIDCSYCDEKNIYRKDLKKHLISNMEDHFLKLIEEVDDLKLKIKKKD